LVLVASGWLEPANNVVRSEPCSRALPTHQLESPDLQRRYRAFHFLFYNFETGEIMLIKFIPVFGLVLLYQL
jgi:hypothetical protein